MRPLSQYEIELREENARKVQERKEVISALKQLVESCPTFLGYARINEDEFYVLTTRWKKALARHIFFVNPPPGPFPDDLRYRWVDKLELLVEAGKLRFVGNVSVRKEEILDHITKLPLSIIEAN